MSEDTQQSPKKLLSRLKFRDLVTPERKSDLSDVWTERHEKRPAGRWRKRQIRLFSENSTYARTWGEWVGESTFDLPSLMRKAEGLVKEYCENHPGCRVYRSEPMEFVAEDVSAGPGVAYGVSIQEV